MKRHLSTSGENVQPRTARPLNAVRGAFVAAGTSLAAWCIQHGVDRSWASRALTGKDCCKSALQLKLRIMKAAGVE